MSQSDNASNPLARRKATPPPLPKGHATRPAEPSPPPLGASQPPIIECDSPAADLPTIDRDVVADAPRWLDMIASRSLRGTLASFVLHLLLLIALALWQFGVINPAEIIAMVSTSPTVADAEPIESVDLAEVAAPIAFETADSLTSAVVVAAAAETIELTPISLPDIVSAEVPREPKISELWSTELNIEATAGIAAAGDRTVIASARPPLRRSDSPSDAVSGIGGEIIEQLAEGNLLVVWMFDASLSMREDRILAGKRMAAVFRELDQRTKESPYEHSEALVCFGNGHAEVVRPTRRWSEVTKGAAKIPDDVSGVEATFTTLQQAVPYYRQQWKEQLMFVVWTDESGDDAAQLEATIDLCKQHEVRVSVVGPTAVLGRQKGVQYYEQGVYSWWLDVDKGPDAGVPQLVSLPHWFGGRAPNVLPSGFGPFGLVRLSQATGGSFTLFDREEDRSPYQFDALQEYLPSYASADEQHAEVAKSPLRSAIVKAMQRVEDVGAVPPPNFDLNFKFWYPPDEYRRRLAPVITADLTSALRVYPAIEEALAQLAHDDVEAALSEEPSARWRASYALARGRLAALSLRYREYALVAEALLAGTALDAASTNAELVAMKQLRTGDWGEARKAEAETWLKICAKEHRGTPWGDLADAEMRTPFGVTLRQWVSQPAGVATPSAGPGPTPPRL